MPIVERLGSWRLHDQGANLSPVLGVLFRFLSAASLQMPAGWLVDRLGVGSLRPWTSCDRSGATGCCR